MRFYKIRLTLSFLFSIHSINCCTNLLVTRGASSDSSSIISYNADSATLYGSIYHYPASDNAPFSKRRIFDWDSGVYLGEIPEVSHTYNVVGNINEFGLIIGESTFGGLKPLQNQDFGKIDYGSLIWVTLQRSKTARDAIKVISGLMEKYGYYSGGESFSIADTEEVWYMEIIGKGNFEIGAVWVAVRIPDGAITAHANQARIRNFPQNDPENCLFSSDIISFARKHGLYSGVDSDFSFSDTYDPVTFEGARFSEARVWSLFGAVMGPVWMSQWQDYAEGKNLTNRMPLFVFPPNKLTVSDVARLMRTHYEETSMDMTGKKFDDAGAAFANIPYRAHPLTWTSSGQQYFHERPVATQQTGWNFIAQSRAHVAPPLTGIIWFGVDDSSTTVRLPVYACATAVSPPFAGRGAQDGVTPPMMTFNMQSAFYVFNVVANFAYSRWDTIYPHLLTQILVEENNLQSAVADMEARVEQVNRELGTHAAVEILTDFSVKQGERLVRRWNDLFGELFVKFRDGYHITASPGEPVCGCKAEYSPYPSNWYDEIVRTTRDHYSMPVEDHRLSEDLWAPVSKSWLLR